MGQSTDAILFFGFDLGEDFIPPWEDDSPHEDWSWDDYYAQKKGLKYPAHLEGLAEFTPEQSDEYGRYLEERSKLVEAAGAKMSTHCSCEYPMHYVYVRETLANRGYPKVIDPDSLRVNSDDFKALREFMKEMGIEGYEDKEPEWHLVSDWC
jgi:hypothetical protein